MALPFVLYGNTPSWMDKRELSSVPQQGFAKYADLLLKAKESTMILVHTRIRCIFVS